MKNILTLTLLLLCVFSTAAMAQDSTSTSTKSATKQGVKRGPVFRATKDQINQAQAILKQVFVEGRRQVGGFIAVARKTLRALPHSGKGGAHEGDFSAGILRLQTAPIWQDPYVGN